MNWNILSKPVNTVSALMMKTVSGIFRMIHRQSLALNDYIENLDDDVDNSSFRNCYREYKNFNQREPRFL
jgi:hypothetical protein